MIASHVGVQLHGKLAGCPLVATVWNESGSLCWRGQLRIEGKKLHDIVRLDDDEPLDPVLSMLLDALDERVKRISPTLEVTREGSLFTCSFSVDGLTLWVVRRGRNSAFAMKLGASDALGKFGSTPIYQQIAPVSNALGLSESSELLLAYRHGDLSLGHVSRGLTTTKSPDLVASANWLLIGKYTFGDSAGEAMQKLFGGTGQLDLMAGYNGKKFAVCLAIPAANTKLVKIDGLFIFVTIDDNGTPHFQFQGSFRVPCWKNVALHAACSFTAESFLLSAEVDFPDSVKVPFLDSLAFETAALLIGIAGGAVTLGFLASLRIRDFPLFGALILMIEGEVPVPALVSGAIGTLKIPDLYHELSGQTIEGLDTLDMIVLDGLGFSLTEPFPIELFEQNDVEGIANFFNAHKSKGWPTLSAAEVQIRKHDGGYALVDRQRMRHYFVDASGNLSLRPQFYYSLLPKGNFGSFSIAPGLFICGRIEVFKKGFEALFSLREGDGLQAYARLDAIEIGRFLRIGKASCPSAVKPIKLAEDDPLGGLVPKKSNGGVFYLSASKRDVAFCFDGKVKLLELFEHDARIVYAARNVSIHLTTEVFGVHAMVAIDASYKSFLSANLRVHMSFDAKALAAGFEKLSKRVDDAIKTLTANIEDAHRALAVAQARVDALYDEIAALDARIAKCKKAIEDASTFKKPFVAIAKGVEILAYEVAQAGIWTAMKTATALLSLAQKAVDAIGRLGEGVLEVVKDAIHLASSLLFIRHVEVEMDINGDEQLFRVNAELVVLGKPLRYNDTVKLNVLQQGISKLLDGELDKKLEKRLQEDAEELERGPTPEPLTVFAERAVLDPGSIPNIEPASAEVDKASALFGRTFERYHANFEEDLSDFDTLRVSFLGAIGVADHALATATKAIAATDTTKLRAMLDSKLVTFSATEEANLDALYAALDEVEGAAALRGDINAASRALEGAWKNVELPPEAKEMAGPQAYAEQPPPRLSEEAFLESLRADVVDAYGKAADTGYINLAWEPNLARYFDDALSALGKEPASKDDVVTLKAFTAERSYRPRL